MTATEKAKIGGHERSASVKRPSKSVTRKALARETSDTAKSDFLKLSLAWAVPSMGNISQVREGLAVKTLEGLNRVLPETVHRIVPKSTLAALKRRSHRLPPEQSDRVYQAGKVIGFALSLYRDEDKVREFLTRSHPMLKGQRPLDVAIESSAGADMVINLLGRGAYGGGA